MPDYTYEEIARMKREAYDEGYKAGYESRLEEELHPKKNQSYEPQGRAAAGSQEDRIEPPSRESAAPLEERLECPPGLKGLGSAGSVQKVG